MSGKQNRDDKLLIRDVHVCPYGLPQEGLSYVLVAELMGPGIFFCCAHVLRPPGKTTTELISNAKHTGVC